MPVDRGGLRYTITVENKFSGALKQFRTQVVVAKKAFRDFKNNVRGLGRESSGVARNLDRIAKAADRVATATARAGVASQDRIAQSQAEADAIRQLGTDTQGLREIQAQRLRSFRIERTAVLKLTTAYERLNAARRAAARAGGRRLDNLLAGGQAGAILPPSRGPEVPSPTAPIPTPPPITPIVDAGKAAATAEKSGSRMLFTFRRLFGVLAAFTAARLAAQGIGELVKQMVEFNRVVETAELSIAALVTASTGVRDALGGAVEPAQRLALAQKEARRQTNLLRRDGLKTAATFAQLVETFQVAVGPGLAAGLSLDEVRKLTIQISQAASAAGVAQNQLSEEIRSILSGTIQQRTTRLAAVLGITNEDIRRAKEAGALVEFLNSRFGAFSEAGEVALGTFEALFSNAKDAVSQLLGAGGLEFFNELKGILKDTIGLATDTDPITGVLSPNPKALAIVESLASGLEGAVEEARRLGGALGFADLEAGAQTIGDTLTNVAQIVGRIIEGFVKGANDLAGVLRNVTNLISQITGRDFGGVESLTTLTRILVVLGGIVLAFKAATAAAAALTAAVTFLGLRAKIAAVASAALAAALRAASITVGLASIAASISAATAAAGGLAAALALVAAKTKAAAAAAALTSAPLLLAAASALVLVKAIAAAFLVMQKLSASAGETKLTFASIASILANDLIAAVGDLTSSFSVVFKSIVSSAKTASLGVAKAFVDAVGRAAGFLATRLVGISKALAATLGGIANARTAGVAALDAQIKKEKESLATAKTRFALEAKDREAQRKATNAQIVNRNKGTGEIAADLLKKAGDAAEALGKRLTGALVGPPKKATEEFTGLTVVLDRLDPILARARRATDAQGATAKKLTEEAKKTSDALEQQAATLGLVGVAQKLQLATVKSAQQTQARSVALVREEQIARAQLQALESRRAASAAKLAGLSEEQRQILTQASGVARETVKSERERFVVLNKVKLAELEIAKARRDGGSTAGGESALAGALQDLAEVEERLDRLRDTASDVFDGLDPSAAKTLGDLTLDAVRGFGEIKVKQEEIKAIQNDRVALLAQEQASLARIITLQARSAAEEIRKTTALRQVNAQEAIRVAQAQTALAQGGGSQAQVAAAQAQAALNIERAKTKELTTQAQKNLDSLRDTRTALVVKQQSLREDLLSATTEKQKEAILSSLVETERARLATKRLITAEEQKLNVEAQKSLALQEAAIANAERAANLAGSNGFVAGFVQLSIDELARLPSAFATTFGIIKGTIQQFSSAAGKLIVDIFDPTTEADPRAALGSFLRSVAQMIISTLIGIAVTAAVTAVVTSFVPGLAAVGAAGAAKTASAIGGLLGSIGGAIGLAEGGTVPGSAAASPHALAARPRGIAKSDTVPAWLTPGETVISAPKSRKYAAGIQGIVSGLINPMDLAALAGARRSTPTARVSRARGFAVGGTVGGLRQGPTAQITSAGRQAASAGPATAVVQANDQSMERMLRGGRGAMLQFVENNRAAFNRALS